MLDDLDQPTATAFERTLMLLAEAGAVLTHTQAPSLRTGGLIVAAEAYAWHAARLDEHGANYDPQVHRRVLSGAKVSAATYLDSLAARAALQRETDRAFAAYDAIVAPTTPCIAPRFDEVASNLDFDRVNAQLLRNTVFANMLDRPAISLPCHQPGDAPVGFMLMGHRMGDRKLFAVAETVERVLADAQ